MTTTFEAAVTLVEQLSPVDQARLVVLLAERLQHTLRAEVPPIDADEPAFWHVPAVDAEWAASEAARVKLSTDGVSTHGSPPVSAFSKVVMKLRATFRIVLVIASAFPSNLFGHSRIIGGIGKGSIGGHPRTPSLTAR